MRHDNTIKVVWLCLFILFFGIQKVYGKTVDMNDDVRINRSEAVQIARRNLVETGLAAKYKLSKPAGIKLDVCFRFKDGSLSVGKPQSEKAYTEEKMWVIRFVPNQINLKYSLPVFVHAQTGEIIYHRRSMQR